RNPVPLATTAATSSGTALSSTTTRRSAPSGTPVSRNRLNGHLRSLRPPATTTARLLPAITRLATISTLASCCQPARTLTNVLLNSLSRDGTYGRGYATSSIVRARSTAAVEPSVRTTKASTGSCVSCSAPIAAAGQ